MIKKQVAEYIAYCEKVGRYSSQTLKMKKFCINDFLANAEVQSVQEITNQHIEKWLSSVSDRGASGRTLNDYQTQVIVLLRWEQSSGLTIPGLNLAKITRAKTLPTRRVSYTREEIKKALAQADERGELSIRLCFDCGLRINELRHIKLSDIKGNQIKIIGKGSKERMVYMSAPTKHLLEKYIEQHKLTNWLWPSEKFPDNPECYEHIRLPMDEAFRRAGFENFYPHALRHSFASDMYKNGAPIKVIQAALGHSYQIVTERYLDDLGENELAEKWKKYKFSKKY